MHYLRDVYLQLNTQVDFYGRFTIIHNERHSGLLRRIFDIINSGLPSGNAHATTLNISTLLFKSRPDVILSGHGTAYTRWGRRDCAGPNTEMLYTGCSLFELVIFGLCQHFSYL